MVTYKSAKNSQSPLSLFLQTELRGNSLSIQHYNSIETGTWLGDEEYLPRHLRMSGRNLCLIDPTPIVDSMFAAILAAT